MESFSFELKLVDSVTAVSKKSAQSVAALGASTQKAQQALGKLQATAIRMNAALDRNSSGKAAKALEAQARAAAKAEAATRRLGLVQIAAAKEDERRKKSGGGNSFFGGFGQKLGFRSVADYAKGAFVGELAASALVGVAGAFVSGAEKAVSLLAGGVKQAFGTAASEATQRISERNILGVEGGRSFRQDVDGFAGKTAFDDGEIRKMMMPARMAGISQPASKQMFATATDLGGNDAGAVGGLMDEFKAIYTQRGVTKKQLKGILGDVGETIPDFYEQLGKKLKVSAKEAEKKAGSNAVDPQLIMNMITEAQNKRQGGEAGTGGKRHADSLEGQYKKLTELPDEFFKKFADSPGYQKAVDAAHSLLENLSPDSENGQKIFAALEGRFQSLTGWMKTAFTPENIDKFAASLAMAVNLVGDLVSGLKSAVDLMSGETLSKAMFSGDAGDVKIDTIDQIRQIGTYSDDELRDRVRGLSASEQTDLVNKGKTNGFDYSPLLPSRTRVSRELVADEAEFRAKPRAASAPVTFNMTFHGGDPAQVKQAVIDAHRTAVSAHERAGNEGS